MRRLSFIVQVHPGGLSVVENLRTRERVRVDDLEAIGPQIERWVEESTDEAGRTVGAGEKGVGDRHPGSVGRRGTPA